MTWRATGAIDGAFGAHDKWGGWTVSTFGALPIYGDKKYLESVIQC